jgi:hypothetical protein
MERLIKLKLVRRLYWSELKLMEKLNWVYFYFNYVIIGIYAGSSDKSA